ncbi:MAG: hypothetical protein KAS32_27970 [Candidatus Peribacteraceae bacterium]|nr:hypothetical protein [Candidatus Peribacteraceae bacterium]
MMQAKSWFETGQLGVDFVTAPDWISTAFGILSTQTSKAMDFKRENK